MTRDPKLDPQPGDVLVLRDGRYRRVVRRRGNDIYYLMGGGYHDVVKFTQNPKEKTCWIMAWMDWCRQADIVETTRVKRPALKKEQYA